MKEKKELKVGPFSRRSGVSVSTLHYYEELGLISSRRNDQKQRLYHRGMLRFVAIIRVAQKLGLTLTEIKEKISILPQNKAPTEGQWKKIAKECEVELDKQIESLMKLKNELRNCIGCGCLSLKQCPLRNPDDILGEGKEGPQLIDL